MSRPLLYRPQQKHPGDDLFERLLTLPNTMVSGQQPFLTDTALVEIAGTTLDNLHQVERKEPSSNDLLR